MKSNYKQLGQYIRQVDIRNRDLSVNRLLGVSISKKFIESIANTVGTDFRNYKIVNKGQFAYGPVTSRNGDKISIALFEEDKCIISSAYVVFEVIDEKELLPEYLMLWFSRPEFDRYSRYMSHGSVREQFSWDEMCKVELPIPSYKEQLEIVKSYNAISERIKLKQKINYNFDDDKEQINKKVEEIGKLVGVNEWIDSLEKKYDTNLYKIFDEAGIEPSGGQGQKLAIARTLYKNSPLVILDEPTAALDPIAEYDIYKNFNSLVGGKTTIYISHRLSSCRFSDRIIVFDNGTIVENGSHDELMNIKDGAYRNMYETQAKHYQ